jgi:hypothetical protein
MHASVLGENFNTTKPSRYFSSLFVRAEQLFAQADFLQPGQGVLSEREVSALL